MAFELPAACQQCGEIFGSGCVIDNCVDASFGGGTVGPCPVCGSNGKVIDGTFDFVENTLSVKKANPETVRVLLRIKYAMDAARAAQSAEAAAAAASEVIPEAKDRLWEASKAGKGAVLLLLAILASKCSFDVKFDINRGIDQVGAMMRPAIELSQKSEASRQIPSQRTPQSRGPIESPWRTPSSDGSTPRR